MTATVEETKRIILRRLDELRTLQHAGLSTAGQDPDALPRPPPPGPAERRPPRPARSRGGGFFRSRSEPYTPVEEHRITALEDRLNALERYLIQALRQHCGAGRDGARARADEAGGHRNLADPAAPPAAARDAAPPESTPTADAESSSPSLSGASFGGEAYRLTGTVEDGLLTDVLQMIASNQKNGRFSLFVDQGASRLDLFFREGEIVHAVAGQSTGESAFFTLMVLGHQRGYYGFLEGDEADIAEPTISTKTQFLILEALRRIDEEGGTG